MSLLMEALKKAEREKLKLENAALSGDDATTLPPLPDEETAPADPVPVQPPKAEEAEGLDFPALSLDTAPSTIAPPEETTPEPVETAVPAPPDAPAPRAEEPVPGPGADLSLELVPSAPPPVAPARDFDTVTHAVPPVEEPPPATAPAAPAPTPAPPVPPRIPVQEASPAAAPSSPATPPPQTARKPEPPRKPASPLKAAAVFSAGKAPAGKLKVSRPVLLAGVAVLVAVGLLGVGGYYYWQLAQPIAPALPPAPPPMPAVAVQVPTPSPEGLTPGQPSVAAVPATPPQPEAASPEMPRPASAMEATPSQGTTPKPQEFASENPAIRIQRAAVPASIDPSVASAYQAFLAGNLAEAAQDYGRTLRRAPNNRDALLGMAAVRTRQGHTEEAVALYTRLLELDPRDAEAQAGLVTLSRSADPVQSESRLKGLLGQAPDSDFLHFALGNLYAGQSRWAEAQQSYFRAFQKAPGNPDYAYNLAVSLDHLEQAKLAVDYYRRALKLTAGRPYGFNREAAENRIEALSATLPAPTAEPISRPTP